MEDLLEIVQKTEEYLVDIQIMAQNQKDMLSMSLWGHQTPLPNAVAVNVPTELPSVTPQQTKKRIKRLSSLNESDEIGMPSTKQVSPRKSTRTSNAQLLAAANAMEEEDQIVPPTPTPAPRQIIEQPVEVACDIQETTTNMEAENELMPPPPAPTVLASTSLEQSDSKGSESSFMRPKRAAKLKSEKNLKEPKLNQKMRRPSNFDKPKVKLEHEQRASQMHAATAAAAVTRDNSTASLASVRSEDSVIAMPTKAPSVVELNSEDEQQQEEITPNEDELNNGSTRKCVIKVKREKVSMGSAEQRPSQEQQKEAANEEPSPPVADTDSTALFPVPKPKAAVKPEPTSDESIMTSSTLSAITASSTLSATTASSVSNAKKGKKKKIGAHKPIKVERFSEIEQPVSTRTRKGAGVARTSGGSVYEDAVDHVPLTEATNTPTTRVSAVPPNLAAAVGMNDTVTMSSVGKSNATMAVGAGPNDATFCANPAQTTFQVDAGQATFIMDNQNANATVTMEKKTVATVDATFNVTSPVAADEQNSLASSQNSMKTAKDTTHTQQDSLITEDESFEVEKPQKSGSKLPNPKAGGLSVKLPASAKAFKMPTRTNELFNPLIQSPVKKKVEAFENAAIAAISTELTKSGRPKRTKENATPSNIATPVIGKFSAPSLGRFLTPTQASNLTPSAVVNAKKGPNSTSKIMAFPKAIANVKSSSSSTTTGKPLSRENSAEDFRKGLHNLAEERKKQREQKHQLAAQQREAKERERAERMAKLAKEREEKRLKKQQEAEQKKRALEEIQRNLRQQEEAEAAKLKSAKAKAIAEQERELLQQAKQQTRAAAKMLPPPPKLQSKYTFEMLHEDDSTDEEEKTSYKRPPPPTWSRSHVRGTAIRTQQYCPTKIIDSFFSVQPMSPDLRLIFPNIGANHLKRNSSAMWSTPPRYSELPKY